jgi:hypothetical protein
MDIFWICMDILGYLRWISFSSKFWICFKKISKISEDIQLYPIISIDIHWYPKISKDIQWGELPDAVSWQKFSPCEIWQTNKLWNKIDGKDTWGMHWTTDPRSCANSFLPGLPGFGRERNLDGFEKNNARRVLIKTLLYEHTKSAFWIPLAYYF